MLLGMHSIDRLCLLLSLFIPSVYSAQKIQILGKAGVHELGTKVWGVKEDSGFVSESGVETTSKPILVNERLGKGEYGFVESRAITSSYAGYAGSYANHEGVHCLFTWKNGRNKYDTHNGTLTTTCESGCKGYLQKFNDGNNGKIPQTGIYVRAKRDVQVVVDDDGQSHTSTYIYKGEDVNDLVPDLHSKVICNNEFGCHSSDLLEATQTNVLKTKHQLSYPINHTVHDVHTGVKIAQPPEQPNGASPFFVRKAVCKCNNGFTSPLQLQSSWCGQECPGPDCALLTKIEDPTHAWCDDLVDGSALSKRRCQSMLQHPSLRNAMTKEGNIDFDMSDMKTKYYMENFDAEQGESKFSAAILNGPTFQKCATTGDGDTEATDEFGKTDCIEENQYWEDVANRYRFFFLLFSSLLTRWVLCGRFFFMMIYCDLNSLKMFFSPTLFAKPSL